MQVSKLLESRSRADIVSCSAGDTLRDVVAMLAEKRIGAMPVMEGGAVVGIVSERDLLYCIAREGTASLDKSVGEVMTAPATSVDCNASCDEVLALMTARRFRHVPVMEGGVMCGFLSIGDLVKSRIDEISHEADAMRDYIRLA